MSSLPVRLQTETLPEPKAALLARLLDGLEPAALHWLSGYTAALARHADNPAPSPVPTTAARLSIVYGSQTGNARRVAERLAHDAEAAGLNARVLRAGNYPLRELATERHLAIVISTQGDGDPPDDALGFVEFIAGKRAPPLPQLRYSVLALGDSSYPKFCSVGRALDVRLAQLGAQRLGAQVDVDVDVDSGAAPWLAHTLATTRDALKTLTPGAGATTASVIPLRCVPTTPAHHREQPFSAEVLANQRIVARDGEREVRHLELSLANSALSYEPGDALGVWPRNSSTLVGDVLAALNLDGERAVGHAGETLPLREWLAGKRELTRLSRSFVALHAARARRAELQHLLKPEQAPALTERMRSDQVIDLLRAYPVDWSADELVAALRPLTPRLYSIASSRKAVGDEAHLTVAVVDYARAGERRSGAASHFLATADADDARVPVFIETNERFRLPRDPTRDILMIGPGTGVAPYRGFVQERRETGARGRNWLLFGNRNFRRDFLYQTEWQQALKDGSLQRLDLAFSRDDEKKIYVQDRLREHGREVYAWLENGAQIYVCGDATRMAKDVHATLIEIVVAHGAHDREAAQAYLSDLIAEGRYARDVY